MRPFRIPFFALALGIALIFAFLLAGPVFAQDELPPAPDASPVAAPTDAPAPAVDAAVPAEAPTIEPTLEEVFPADPEPTEAPTSEPTQAAPVDEAPVVTEEAAPPPADTVVAQALDAIANTPEGVDVVLTNAQGETVSLATTEAAPILTAGDPWFKVGLITYHFLSGTFPNTCANLYPSDPNCHEAVDPIWAAIDYIGTNGTIPTDGIVHVEAGNYPGTDVTINGTNPNIAKLKGLVGHLSPTTNLPDAILTPGIIEISDMPGAFLLSGFNISGPYPGGQTVSLQNNAGTITLQDMVVTNLGSGSGTVAIRAVQKGSIVLTRVDSSGNESNAVDLNNSSGTGSVTITNGTFDRNNGTTNAALTITSKGAISLNYVSAGFNQSSGLIVYSTKSLTIKSSTFHNNDDYGILVPSSQLGSITIDSVYLNSNGEDGANLNLAGTISLANVMANSNYGYGVNINTCGVMPCTYTGTGAVTISNSKFNFNQRVDTPLHKSGLLVNAKGAISLTNVEVVQNGYYTNSADRSESVGAILNNSDAASPANISIIQGTFDKNFWFGLQIITKGSVTLNTINANKNGISLAPNWQINGLEIEAQYGTGSVTLTSTMGDSNFSDNDGSGIVVWAKGNVSLSGLTKTTSQINDNGFGGSGYGVLIDNSSGTGTVTVRNFQINSNESSGISVQSKGIITLDSLDVLSNGVGVSAWGARIYNDIAPSTAGVIVNTSKFNENSGGGIGVWTHGSTTFNGVTASKNTTYSPNGAVITSTGSGTVTILATKGPNEFSENGHNGLSISAHGKVSLDNLSVKKNSNQYGLYIVTTTSGDVSINKLIEDKNGYSGLFVTAYGNISLDNSEIRNSDQVSSSTAGVFLSNANLVKTVTISRTKIYDTMGNGLEVDSKGLITLNNVDSSNNILSGYGAYLHNNYFGSTAGVSLLSTYGINTFNGNHNNGLQIDSNGPVSISKITASNNNGGDGVRVINTGGTGSVTVSGVSGEQFTLNSGSAVYIESYGNISVSDVTALTNLSPNYGIYLNNITLTTLEPTVKVIRTSVTVQPGTGIFIRSKGTVTLDTVTSSGITQLDRHGVDIDNRFSGKYAGISILGTYGRNDFSSNAENGLLLYSDGTISVSKADVNSNLNSHYVLTTAGAYLDNTSGTGNIVITDSYFNENARKNGVTISTIGTVTWTGGGASGNGDGVSGVGAAIDNSASPLPMAVSISKAIFNSNNGDGLNIYANGNITLNGIVTGSSGLDEYGVFQLWGNNGYGAYLRNDSTSGGVNVISTLGSNTFSENYYDGLFIMTKGAVVLSKITSHGNLWVGINVTYNVTPSVLPISFTTGTIDQNGFSGISLRSAGNISLSSINAFNNGISGSGDGAYLVNETGSVKTISVTKSSFNKNDSYGLEIHPSGVVTLNAVQANDNNISPGYDGVFIYNPLDTEKVDVLSTMGASIFSGNYSLGLAIRTNGSVTISGVSANENGNGGLYIENDYGGTGSVSLINCNTSKNSGSTGISVTSSGAVSISSSKALSNGAGGAFIDNRGDTTGTKNIVISNSIFNSGLGGGGLTIYSYGAVLLTSINASNNPAYGVLIYNADGGSTIAKPAVTVNGTNTFNSNQSTGLSITTLGAINLSNISSSYNSTSGYGLNLTNYSVGSTSSITITNVVLKENYFNGIYAYSSGPITISGMIALFNGTVSNNDGAYLYTTDQDITIKSSSFIANGKSGIYAITGLSNTLFLSSVNYFGNDYSGGALDPDLFHMGYLVFN
jgi:hypothetical protein